MDFFVFFGDIFTIIFWLILIALIIFLLVFQPLIAIGIITLIIWGRRAGNRSE